MLLFDRSCTIGILVDAAAPEPVRLAAADLQRDLRRLAGRDDGFALLPDGVDAHAIHITTEAGDTPEGYTVRVGEEGVSITGTDTLGTVFGIYAFSTHCLGVLPLHRMIDCFPAARAAMTLAPRTVTSPVRRVRFRGWFLNDEDLLTDFRPGGGRRDIDYPFYENVMHTDVLDMALETALRLEINLVIPSSFVDIANPDEEKLVRAVCRRGLYISQHHVEPMGVSYFAADAYMKRHGAPDEAVSFVRNRARMEEIWRDYAARWAVWGDRVVWQFGLRGKADQSVWKADPSVPMSPAARGAIITDAIAVQHRIVSETLGRTDFPSTATLWMEGAELYGRGHLRIPDQTIVVFSDVGFSQLFGDDFYRVERGAGKHYGVYYHAGFWGEGPHLAEGCDLRKMAFSYREAWAKRSLDYSILNVSNIRPLHIAVWLNARLLADPAGTDSADAADAMLHDLFGDAAEQVKPLFWAYYDTIADLGSAELIDRCRRYEFCYHDYGPLDFPELPVTDGLLRSIGRRILDGRHYTVDDARFGEVLEASLARWEALSVRMDAAAPTLPADCRRYFAQFLQFETFYMLQMTRWLLACRTMMQAKDAAARGGACTAACAALTAILEARTILEQDSWAGWHNGEKKINVSGLLALTKQTYLKKEITP